MSNAATIDLTDNSFTSVTYQSFVQGPLGPIIAFSETVAGVVFSFVETGPGTFPTVGTWGNGTTNSGISWALGMGGGGGSTHGFQLTVSQDVTLESFIGLRNTISNPSFDVIGTGVSSLGNTWSVSGFVGSTPEAVESFNGGPLSLVAGAVYSFDVTSPSVIDQGYFTGLNFSVPGGPATVPLPASLPLLAAGLGLFGVMRRRKSRAMAA